MDETYSNFLASLESGTKLDSQSSDEDFVAQDLPTTDTQPSRIPKTEIFDLLTESTPAPEPIYRPELPILPAFCFTKTLTFSKEERVLLMRQLDSHV